jgi:Ca2+-binding EF-hand superfamily protein
VFTVETRRLFRRVLGMLIQNEATAEQIREGISSQGYSLGDAFDYLDRNQDGFISPIEFQETLRDYGIVVTRQEAAGLVERYDTRGNGRVSYRDFVAESSPKSPSRY